MGGNTSVARNRRNNNQGPVNITSDIVNLLANNTTAGQQDGANPNPAASGGTGPDIEMLRSIDATLKSILQRTPGMSQSDARNQMPGRQFGAPQRDENTRDPFGRQDSHNGFSMDSVGDGFRDAIMEGLLGSDFRENIMHTMNDFASELGVNVSDLPNMVGKQMGKNLMNAFKNTNLGQAITGKIQNLASGALSNITSLLGGQAGQGGLGQAISGLAGQAGATAGASGAAGALSGAATAGAGAATAGAGAATAGAGATAMAGAGAAGAVALGPLVAAMAPVVAGFILLSVVLDTLGPAIEGISALFKGMGKAANRYEESRKKNLEESKKRIAADYKTIIEEPFNILKEAANEWYKVWDEQLRTITATQGYNKDSLYDLMGNYAERLRSEGLTSVVSSSDISNNLAKVLEGGLSGAVAEEFAYIATKLNAAIPTQDFFNYAETYASLAANAIKNGYSEAEAIAYANVQIQEFASNVLYASRQIAGGFSSGLKDAQSLFESSAQIATAAKTGNASMISGVLTSVSAIVGAIAPDLSSNIVESVVKAATGGNSSDIVALRSLAGINASNTEFLKALATNPQEVFSTMFTNLAKMQNMSNDNFMEVAEGLADVFGISMDAFARVDFNYLAQAISQMNVNNASLDENMQLLVSGQTTTTAEQLKMQQINAYMLEEGLAYVLDNAAARAIQEHMWDEQIARELQESSYSVELQGSALDFLEGISQTVQNIIDFLNPFSWFKKLGNLIATKEEADAQKADLTQFLELGKVGQGNAKAFMNLLTTNKDLKLTDSLVNLMGGHSAYAQAKANTQRWNQLANPITSFSSINNRLSPSWVSLIESAAKSANAVPTSSLSTNSKYGWNTAVSKSVANALATAPQGSAVASTVQAATTAASSATKANSRFQEFLDSMDKYVQDQKSYDDWKASASKYGIKDFEQALEDFGQTEAQLKGAFQSQEAGEAAKQEHERALKEEDFWKAGTAFWLVKHPDWEEKVLQKHTDLYNYLANDQLDQLTQQTLMLTYINSTTKKLYDSWVDYFVNHTAYSKATLNAHRVKEIQNAEKDGYGDSIQALAQALTSNAVDLKDPAVQTNALLAKILIVAEQLLQQNASSSGGSVSSISTTLAALGLGITT